MAVELVTLDKAKAHLRVMSVDEDADIHLKIQQASGIIVDYLKSRAHVVSVVTSSSVAVATVITTATAHGVTSGQTVTLAGHEDSVPELNGSHVATVLTTLTFTVPVTVTTAGTGGTVTLLWTAATVPMPVQASVLLMLTHLHEHRGEDMAADEAVWTAIARLLMRSRDPAFA